MQSCLSALRCLPHMWARQSWVGFPRGGRRVRVHHSSWAGDDWVWSGPGTDWKLHGGGGRLHVQRIVQTVEQEVPFHPNSRQQPAIYRTQVGWCDIIFWGFFLQNCMDSFNGHAHLSWLFAIFFHFEFKWSHMHALKVGWVKSEKNAPPLVGRREG